MYQRSIPAPKPRVLAAVYASTRERARREAIAPQRAAVQAAIHAAMTNAARIPFFYDEEDPSFQAALADAFKLVRAEREQLDLEAALHLLATHSR